MGYPGRSLFGERSSNVQIKSGNTTIVVQKQGDTYYVQSNPDAPPTFKYDPLEFEISDDQLSFKAPAAILSEMQAAGRTGNPLGIMAFRNKVDYLTEVINKPDTAGSVDPNTLGTLAYKDDVDYETEVLNKPDLTLYSQWSQLGDLATKTQVDWNLDIANRPDLSVYQPLASNLTSLSAASPSTSGLVINGNAASPRSLEWPTTGLTIDHTVTGSLMYQPARTVTSSNPGGGNFYPNLLSGPTLNVPAGTPAIGYAATFNIANSPAPGTNCTLTRRYGLMVAGLAGTGNPGGVGAMRTEGLVTFSHIVPEVNNSYDLGTSALRFRNVYMDTALLWNTTAITIADHTSAGTLLTQPGKTITSSSTTAGNFYPNYLQGPTLNLPVGAATVPYAATVNIFGGPTEGTNCTITNRYGLIVSGGTNASNPGGVTGIRTQGVVTYNHIVAETTNLYDLGTSTLRFRTAYLTNLDMAAAGRVFGSLLPNATNGGTLGSSSLRWGTTYTTDLNVAGAITGALTPATTATYALGATSNRWATAYLNNLDVSGRTLSSLIPNTTSAYDLGTSALRWNNLWVQNLDVSGAITGNLELGKAATGTTPTINFYTSSTTTPNASITRANIVDGDLIITNTGVGQIQLKSAGNIMLDAGSGYILPNATNTRQLGHGSYRWSNVYTTNLDFSGTLTGNIYPNVKPLLVAGTGISLTTDDTAKTITVAATGSGGSFQPLNQNLTDLSDTTATLYNNTSAAATFTVLRLLTPNLVYSSTNDTVPNAQIVLGRSEANGLSGLISYGYRSSSTPNYNRIGLGLYGNPYILSVSNDSVAAVKISATASSGGKTSGALVVTGGIGCGENISLAGQIFYQTAASAAGMYSFLKYSDAGNKQLWFQDSGNATSSNTYPTFRIGFDGTRSWLGSVSTDGTTTLPLYIYSNLLPTTDNGYLCGSSSYRWSTVYSVNGVVTTSDENEKTEIVELTKGLEIVNQLKPITYKFKTGDTKTHFGLGARKTKEVLDAQGFTNYSLVESSASPWGLNYSEVVAPLIKAVQQLSQQVTDLKTRISVLEQKTVRLPII